METGIKAVPAGVSLTLVDFVKAHPEIVWAPRGETKTIYSTHQERWLITREVATELAQVGWGLDRIDRLGEAGIYAAELDAGQFANDLVSAFSDDLSLREVRLIYEAFGRELEACEASRQAAMGASTR